MKKKLAQKTLKVELEITVSVNDVGEAEANTDQEKEIISHLQSLQQALINQDAALNRQMLAAVIAKLQGYIDQIATQDANAQMAKLVEELKPEEQAYFEEKKDQFADLTRNLRTACMDIQLENAAISEKVEKPGECPAWQPIWQDLLLDINMGKYGKSSSYIDVKPSPSLAPKHFLLARMLTRQADGVHFEARCSCDQFLEGAGEDEDQAFQSLWIAHRKHLALVNTWTNMKSTWKNSRKRHYSRD